MPSANDRPRRLFLLLCHFIVLQNSQTVAYKTTITPAEANIAGVIHHPIDCLALRFAARCLAELRSAPQVPSSLTPKPPASPHGGFSFIIRRIPMKLSASSQARLDGAHPLLQKLFAACAADPNCPAFTILDGQRGRVAQEKAFASGHSKAHFGQSAHNWAPAIALDVCPYPIDWNNIARFVALSKVVKAKAKAMNIPLAYGGDWKSIKDFPHYELDPWRTFAAKSKPFAG